jgi:hypothetical protein
MHITNTPNLLPNQKPFSHQITNPSDLTVDSGVSSYFGDLNDQANPVASVNILGIIVSLVLIASFLL